MQFGSRRNHAECDGTDVRCRSGASGIWGERHQMLFEQNEEQGEKLDLPEAGTGCHGLLR